MKSCIGQLLTKRNTILSPFQLNTLLVLLTIRRLLIVQRVSLSKSTTQLHLLPSALQMLFIRSVYRQLHTLVCVLPALAVLWLLSVLALEQTQTQIFQFIYALLSILFSMALFVFHRKSVTKFVPSLSCKSIYPTFQLRLPFLFSCTVLWRTSHPRPIAAGTAGKRILSRNGVPIWRRAHHLCRLWWKLASFLYQNEFAQIDCK